MLVIDPLSALPRYRQLYDGLRRAILAGQLAPGTRLPSTRALATELRVARNTVVNAFAQLIAEGYIEGKIGAGTQVAASLPDDLLRASPPPKPSPSQMAIGRALAQRGELLAAATVSTPRLAEGARAFRTGSPDYALFPFAVWSQLAARRWRQPAPNLLGYGDPAGYWPLREAVAAYLGEARALRCTAEQVIIVAGSQQGLDLATRLLLDPGDAAWLEDPGYAGARGALTAAGARIIPVPVGAEGLDVAAGEVLCPTARLAYVSPSHHFPLGVTLSLAQRLALLDWAERSHAWILEDDYDSEYRYTSRPLAALQGLDHANRVIYIGTFSKVLFPSLRVGYLVVPPDLVAAFIAARAVADRHSPTVEQAIIADFITEGHFARHIRRMRTLYAERQATLIEAAHAILGDALTITPNEAGMHLVGWLPPGMDDVVVAHRAAELGIAVQPLSAYYATPEKRNGILLGYAAVTPTEIRAGVQQLARALHQRTR
jgi:GntR family transcriptional regulator/MocR family aminotransferase